ncbi:MAG: RNA polymerase-associated protein RapA, partial [Verrucomicrobiota bacterium]
SKPEDRLINGQVDQSETYTLRYQSVALQSAARKSPVAGFIGGRIDLIPHQLYIASEVSNRHLPRVLLADEVGLGKTIEACLILHRLHLTGRAKRVLILLPDSLVHQWFVELLRRFNLWFTLFDDELCESILAGNSEANPFLEEQLVICSRSMLLKDERWARYATEANWDMLIVDEAHHLDWEPDHASADYLLVEALAGNCDGLLLLTATPEQLGTAGHFARLRLLDPERYPSIENFVKEQSNFVQVASVASKLESAGKLSKEDLSFLREVFVELDDAEFDKELKEPTELLSKLIDRHGTGRVIFRNTRDALKGFPQRKALPASLEPRKTDSEEELQARLLAEFDLNADSEEGSRELDYRRGPRIKWLSEFLKNSEEKVLLICRTKEKVEAINAALLEEINVKAAVFHEELSLIQRDRNAAWFAEAEGARILLCSEIGSEGRNFQFANHLVLFDLPLNPELLEQRIGRLDRIGQTNTIHVHMPFLRQSYMELLMRWHHEGINGVEHSLKGGNAYLDRFGAALRELGPIYHIGAAETVAKADALIEESRRFQTELEAKLSKGQDRLIALNSFRETDASELVSDIAAEDSDQTLDNFMNRIFDHFGVNVEDLDERSLHLEPGQMFTDSFPGLPEEGTTVTFSRKRALGREDIGFLTWDHPMVRGSIDLILSSEKGNSAIAVWTKEPAGVPPIIIEAIFILECVAPAKLHMDRFLPPTPIRVVVDMKGSDLTENLGHALINRSARDEESFRLKQNPDLLRALVPNMLQAAREHARLSKSAVLEAAVADAHARLDGEAERLRDLKLVNPNVRDEEIEIAERHVHDVTKRIAKAHLRLDAVRMVLQAPK